MPDSNKHHSHSQSDHKDKSAVNSNTGENAMLAAQTARENLAKVTAGKVWKHTAPRGEREIKGSFELNDQLLFMLRFSPADGSLLPVGLHGLNQGTAETMAIVQERLKQLCSELVVLDGAEFREPECCWAIPIAHQGRIVAHIKVSADGASVIPDYKAADELRKS